MKRKKRTDQVARERYVYNLRTKYGLRPEDYVELGILQGWACAVCFRTREELQQDLVPDHCHKEGYVRGLLCKACNQALGLFGDDVNRLTTAVEYLQRRKR